MPAYYYDQPDSVPADLAHLTPRELQQWHGLPLERVVTPRLAAKLTLQERLGYDGTIDYGAISEELYKHARRQLPDTVLGVSPEDLACDALANFWALLTEHDPTSALKLAKHGLNMDVWNLKRKAKNNPYVSSDALEESAIAAGQPSPFDSDRYAADYYDQSSFHRTGFLTETKELLTIHLTEQERRLAYLLVEGYSFSECALILQVSRPRVTAIRRRLAEKLAQGELFEGSWE